MALDLSTIKSVLAKSGITFKEVKQRSDGKTLWKSGAIVTYVVDTNEAHTEEVDSGASCLSPSFTPSKSGYTFVGWREDKTASADVLTSKVMAGEPITLHAVFKQNITATYYDNSTTASKASGVKYYNNGNVAKPSFTLTQATKTGWSAIGWTTGTAGNITITYANGATFERDSDVTLYGRYQQKITLSYDGNGATSGSTKAQEGIRSYNSNGNIVNPEFTLAGNGFAKTNYSFNGWNLGAVGAKITLAASTTAYAQWIGVPYTWVSDYVGSGAGLTITITDADNAHSLSTGQTLNRFDVASYHDDDLEYMSIDFRTNSADTRGLKYMTLTFPDFMMGRNTDGAIRDYVRVMSSDGTILKEWNDRVYGGSQKIDVSSASSVYIVGCIGAWGQSQSPCARVQAITFSN